jgi:exonuclease SbcD
MKFIHAADIHLDSPMRGLQVYDGAPVEEMQDVTRFALENLVDLALTEEVSFVVIAGDLYDGDWDDYNTGLYLSKQCSKLREAGIGVIAVSGNHDAASQITRRLRSLDNLKWLSTNKPETIILEDHGVAIHGQGFSKRAVTDNLAISYPKQERGLFNVGILHTCLNGREGHEPYAPCRVEDLLLKDYEYWALGHVHNFEVVQETPWVVFPGCLQGRNARELGPKGCVIVDVEDGRVETLQHRELDEVRWCACSVDATGARSGEEVLDLAQASLEELCGSDPEKRIAVRIVVKGACRAHGELISRRERWVNELRIVADNESGGSAWLEEVRFNTRPEPGPRRPEAGGEDIGGIISYLLKPRDEERIMERVAEELKDLGRKLPAELKAEGGGECTVSPWPCAVLSKMPRRFCGTCSRGAVRHEDH